MITTLELPLQEVSQMLNETTTDTSTKRIGYANRAFEYVISAYKWQFRRKYQSLTTVINTQTYDLTSASIITDNDYDPLAGIYEIWNGTEKLDPVLYDNVDNFTSSDCFALKPDNKTLVFTLTMTSADTYDLWYYAKHSRQTSYTATLPLSVPEQFLIPIATYIKHLIHDGRRQRIDARNCILDVQEQISDLKLADAASKIKGLPKNVPTPMQYSKFKRSYSF